LIRKWVLDDALDQCRGAQTVVSLRVAPFRFHGAVMTRLVLIAMGLLVGVFALVCWQLPDKKSPPPLESVASSQTAQEVAAAPTAPASPPDIGDSPALQPVPGKQRPFVERRSDLERRARAGDGHAAWRLGMALANCNGYVPISDEKLESSLVDAFASGMTVSGTAPEAMLHKLKLGAAQKRRDCSSVAGLNESDTDNAANKKAFHWMELGASLGDADAQAMFAALAFETFDARNALADTERIRERKRDPVLFRAFRRKHRNWMTSHSTVAKSSQPALRSFTTAKLVNDEP
jgi:hypothetical protein